MLNRFQKLSAETKRVINPIGTGKIIQYRSRIDKKTGQVITEKIGEINLQARMNEEAKTIDFMSLLKEAEEGKRKRVPGSGIDTSISPKNKYEAYKNVQKLIDSWDKNPLLRMVYKDKASLMEAVNKNEDVLKKAKEFGVGLVENVEKLSKKANDEKLKRDDQPKPLSSETKKDISIEKPEVK